MILLSLCITAPSCGIVSFLKWMLANWLGFSVKVYEGKVHTIKIWRFSSSFKGETWGHTDLDKRTLWCFKAEQWQNIIMPQGCTYLKIVFSHKRKPFQIRILCKVIGNHLTRYNKSLTCDWFCMPINPYVQLHAMLLHNMSLSRDKYFKFKRAHSSTIFWWESNGCVWVYFLHVSALLWVS